MALKITDIVWDTDGEDVDLPEEVSLEVDGLEEDRIADALSDKFGWAVVSYSTEPEVSPTRGYRA